MTNELQRLAQDMQRQSPHLKELVEDERSQQGAGSASALGHTQSKANQHRMEGDASLQDL